ncbi:MAG: D-2-hydroxyacid dehydrogenase [Pseudomonadota bacterium]
MTATRVMIIPGLTLQHVCEDDLRRMQEAAGDDSCIVVCNPDQAHTQIADTQVVLGLVSPSLFAQANKLRWVQSISSGVDSFMYPAFINSPVMLTSEKGLVGEHLADHGMGLLLMLTRQLAAARDLGPAAWHNRSQLRAEELELTDMTMGIIGFGGTGRAMARRAAAFGMQVRAIDREQVPPAEGLQQVEPVSHLLDVLAAVDVVAVCCPLTRETHGLLNSATLARTKPGAFIINVTRGEVIEEAALAEALQSGHIRGAGLDVAPREPLPADSVLWQLPNVVMTPHTAGASQFRAARNIQRFIDNLNRFIHNEPLEGIINKTLGY